MIWFNDGCIHFTDKDKTGSGDAATTLEVSFDWIELNWMFAWKQSEIHGKILWSKWLTMSIHLLTMAWNIISGCMTAV